MQPRSGDGAEMPTAELGHLRVPRVVAVLLAIALSAVPVGAQSIVDGERVEFLPSPDTVTSYTLNVYASGTTTLVSTANLGMPTPDTDGYMRVAYVPLLTTPLQAGVIYDAMVVANGPNGSSSSAVSNTFMLTGPCGSPTISPSTVNVGAAGARGTVNGTLAYSVSANTTTSALSGTISVANNTFSINQAAACSYTIAPTSQSLGAAGGTGSVAVTTGATCAWTAASNNTSWLTVTSGASGTGNGTVAFSAAANTATSTRAGTITIGGNTFTVNQAAGCSYSIAPTSQSLGAAGGTGSVTLTDGSTCGLSAVI